MRTAKVGELCAMGSESEKISGFGGPETCFTEAIKVKCHSAFLFWQKPDKKISKAIQPFLRISYAAFPLFLSSSTQLKPLHCL